MMRGHSQQWELNVLTLRKGNERYIYLFDDASRASLIDVFRDQAADPLMSLSWLDVPTLNEKAREQARAAADEPPAESRI
ncbi:MAG TPA: hypothetical protein VGZ47_16540 [Gemmataceae bacterium]|jgi:hypothetical protein|nr:hypothetical protein [Gemmataceae bacterium]